jgi:hypothetical protein
VLQEFKLENPTVGERDVGCRPLEIPIVMVGASGFRLQRR